MHFILLLTFIASAFLVRKMQIDIFNCMVSAKYFRFRQCGGGVTVWLGAHVKVMCVLL